MGYIDFTPFGIESIEIKFQCNNCDNEVHSEEIGVPTPNYAAEKARDSYNDNYGHASCSNCEEDYDVWVNAGYSGGSIEIEGISDDDIIEIIEHPEELDSYYEDQIDAILNSPEYDFLFITEINNLKSLNDIALDDPDLQKTLQRQIYSSAITCLEDYLSTKLIKQVLNEEENFKNFVRTFHQIQKRKFSLSELYEKLEQIESIVKKELLDVIYHDLPKVKGMYEDSLKINFPDISKLMKAINIRHDMVHRNGKNKEGKEIEITKEVVTEVIKDVETFVRAIDEEIIKINNALLIKKAVSKIT